MFRALAVVGLACVLRECTCITLVVDTPYQQVMPDTPFKFMCQADAPLAGCQVKYLVSNNVFDLSFGNQSSYYWGTGLENGQCGFTASNNVTVGAYIPFSCRARAHGGSWEYAEAVVQSTNSSSSDYPTIARGQRMLVVDQGQEVVVSFIADRPLTLCGFRWPGQNELILNGSSHVYSVDTSNKARGHCKLTLHNVTSDMSGVVYSLVWWTLEPFRHEVQLTTLLVNQAPSAPALSLSRANGVYKEGDVIEASCNVGPARPVTRITWLFNDDVIHGEAEDFDTWPWEFEAGSVTRKLSGKLSINDDGKELVCRVHHVALPGGVVETRKKISVRRATGPPGYTRTRYIGIRLHKSGGSFDDAGTECALDGGHLAIPRTKRIQDRMVSMLNASEWAWAFVGVHDLAAEGEWMTVLDERWSSVGHTEWGEGEPNNGEGKEHCATIRRTGVLSDFDCSEKAAFFCEIDRAPVGFISDHPNCGVRGASVKPLVAGGTDASEGEFPWHVGIYRTEGGQQDKQICGGTLISKTFVISAAHCFWHDSDRRLKAATIFKVAAGKFRRDWNERERNAQHRDVTEIKVPDRFRGRNSDFKHDIAVVRLAQDVEWTDWVSPICLDLDEDRVGKQSVGLTGTTVGWGLTHEGVSSDVLQKVDLPIVDFETCFDAIHENVRKFYTEDKFCAGFANKSTSVCTGDSGGGLVFHSGDRYYLRGVTSMGFTPPGSIPRQCFSELYTGFTDVAQFLSWVEEVAA